MKKELVLNKCNNIYSAARNSSAMLKHINNGYSQFVVLNYVVDISDEKKDKTLENIIFLAEAHGWKVKIIEI